jgi:type VI secretion system secreted protein Hcp
MKGESQDDKHKDWIECASVHWGIHQPKSATASTGGGHTAERAELKEVTFTKVADLASPILMQHCAMGKTIPKAKFEFMRADGNGQPIKYFEIELENVLIGGIEPGIEPGTCRRLGPGCKQGRFLTMLLPLAPSSGFWSSRVYLEPVDPITKNRLELATDF